MSAKPLLDVDTGTQRVENRSIARWAVMSWSFAPWLQVTVSCLILCSPRPGHIHQALALLGMHLPLLWASEFLAGGRAGAVLAGSLSVLLSYLQAEEGLGGGPSKPCPGSRIAVRLRRERAALGLRMLSSSAWPCAGCSALSQSASLWVRLLWKAFLWKANQEPLGSVPCMQKSEVGGSSSWKTWRSLEVRDLTTDS